MHNAISRARGALLQTPPASTTQHSVPSGNSLGGDHTSPPLRGIPAVSHAVKVLFLLVCYGAVCPRETSHTNGCTYNLRTCIAYRCPFTKHGAISPKSHKNTPVIPHRKTSGPFQSERRTDIRPHVLIFMPHSWRLLACSYKPCTIVHRLFGSLSTELPSSKRRHGHGHGQGHTEAHGYRPPPRSCPPMHSSPASWSRCRRQYFIHTLLLLCVACTISPILVKVRVLFTSRYVKGEKCG